MEDFGAISLGDYLRNQPLDLDSFLPIAIALTDIIGTIHEHNIIYKPISQVRGYFISGKYDQFQRNIPYSAIIQAFRELMGQLVSESEADLKRWKTTVSVWTKKRADKPLNLCSPPGLAVRGWVWPS